MDALDKALAEMSEQGSGMWHDVRAGRFTASEIWKLMESGSRLMTEAELKARPKSGPGSKSKYIEDASCLSNTTQTYIRTKVAETLTGHAAEPVFSRATEYGDEMEPFAAQYFTERTGMEFEIVSFVPYTDHAGGSPDRKIKGKNELLEIKCPYNSANQVDYLMLTDQWDLKREYPEYYWQCMANMLFFGADLCHFITYDPRMIEDKHKMTHIKIKPIEEDQQLIVTKLGTAVKEKLALLNILK